LSELESHGGESSELHLLRMSMTLRIPFGISYSTRNNLTWNISTGQ